MNSNQEQTAAEIAAFASARDLLERPFHLSSITGVGFEAEETRYAHEHREDSFEADSLGEDMRRAITLREELEDEDFENVLDNLLEELELEADRLGQDETPEGSARTARHLARWLEPLAEDSERVLDEFESRLEGQDLRALSDTELEDFLDRATPEFDAQRPVFDEFLGKIFKKAKAAVKSVAKKAAAVASKLIPFKAILRRLKALVRPLLNRVLLMARHRLPPALRPYADKLAARFGGKGGTALSTAVSTTTAQSIRGIARQFDSELAAVTLAGASEAESIIDEVRADAAEESYAQLELDTARARFVAGMRELEEGQDPTPLVQEFLPAVLPALKLGIAVAGRPNVVNGISGYLGRLLAPYVGPQVRQALSRAIVDAGLRMINLETTEEEADDTIRGAAGDVDEAEAEAPSLAAEAFANMVEESARVVSGLDDSELEGDLALEAAVVEGFREGVATSLPAKVLVAEQETSRDGEVDGVWVARPRGRSARYLKRSRVYPVRLTSAKARAVRVFGGRSLDSVLRASRSRPGPLDVRVHLVQAVPGSRARRILSAERAASPGLTINGNELHPLTPEAAGLLLGDPSLGRELSEEFAQSADTLEPGERLYFLEVAEPSKASGRPSDLDIAVDLAAREVRIGLFRSEADAQTLARSLRDNEPLGPPAAAIVSATGRRLDAVVATPTPRIRVTSGNRLPTGRSDLLSATGASSKVIARAVERWLSKALSTGLLEQKDAVLRAAESPSDGLTLLVSFRNPPGIAALAALLLGRSPNGISSVTELRRALAGPAQSALDVVAGYRRA